MNEYIARKGNLYFPLGNFKKEEAALSELVRLLNNGKILLNGGGILLVRRVMPCGKGQKIILEEASITIDSSRAKITATITGEFMPGQTKKGRAGNHTRSRAY